MLAFLSKWKWYIVATFFLIYSVGIWNVSGGMKDLEYTKIELNRADMYIADRKADDSLRADITAALAKALADHDEAAKKITKAILDEVLKDPVYKSCRVTDGVRAAIQRKLDSQTK